MSNTLNIQNLLKDRLQPSAHWQWLMDAIPSKNEGDIDSKSNEFAIDFFEKQELVVTQSNWTGYFIDKEKLSSLNSANRFVKATVVFEKVIAGQICSEGKMISFNSPYPQIRITEIIKKLFLQLEHDFHSALDLKSVQLVEEGISPIFEVCLNFNKANATLRVSLEDLQATKLSALTPSLSISYNSAAITDNPDQMNVVIEQVENTLPCFLNTHSFMDLVERVNRGSAGILIDMAIKIPLFLSLLSKNIKLSRYCNDEFFLLQCSAKIGFWNLCYVNTQQSLALAQKYKAAFQSSYDKNLDKLQYGAPGINSGIPGIVALFCIKKRDLKNKNYSALARMPKCIIRYIASMNMPHEDSSNPFFSIINNRNGIYPVRIENLESKLIEVMVYSNTFASEIMYILRNDKGQLTENNVGLFYFNTNRKKHKKTKQLHVSYYEDKSQAALHMPLFYLKK